MNYAAFLSRFPEQTEIGHQANEDGLAVYYDNGKEIGVWRQPHDGTECRAAILTGAEADLARSWFPTTPSPAARDLTIRKALETAISVMECDGIQALRGLAWTDNDMERLHDGLAALEWGRGW